MMMSGFSWCTAVSVLLANAIAMPAEAAVTYSFSDFSSDPDNGFDLNFVLITDSFIKGQEVFDPSSLQSCTGTFSPYVVSTCAQIDFNDPHNATLNADNFGFTSAVDAGFNTTTYTFGIDTFASLGTFHSRSGTLTITGTSAVPEPDTWLMLILGMGGVGYIARRQQINYALVPGSSGT
jgi:hypothetical protein